MAVIAPANGTALADGNRNAGTLPSSAQPAQTMEVHPAWPMISRLPTVLSVSIPLSGLRVCDLLALQLGQTIESAWEATEDVPLKAGSLQICWGEFEVVDQRTALRLTRLA